MAGTFDRVGARTPRDPRTLPGGFWQLPPGLAAVYVFGSTVNGRRGPEPDLDIALLAGEPAERSMSRMDIGLAWRGRLVDALASERIDVIVLNGAPLLLCHRVVRDGRLLSCLDPMARVRFEVGVGRRYCDSAWMRDLFRESLKRTIVTATECVRRG